MKTFSQLFVYIFRDDKEIKINKQVGHMLRTKLSHVNEGGVAAGLGALDSVILIDSEPQPQTDCDCCSNGNV